MPPALIATAQAQFGGLPGVTITRAQWLHDRTTTLSGGDAGDARGVILTADVWGPTLHRRVRRWSFDMSAVIGSGPDAPAVTDEQAIDRVRIGMHHLADVQRRLHAYAADEDIDAPMAHQHGYAPCDIAHLCIHRGLADLMIANRGGRGAMAMLLDQLQRMIGSDQDGSETMIETSELADDMQTTVRFDGSRSTLHRFERMGSDVTFERNVVSMGRALPDTVMAAVAGMALGDVVRTGIRSLDATPIIGCVRDGLRTSIEIADDPVRIGDHEGLTG